MAILFSSLLLVPIWFGACQSLQPLLWSSHQKGQEGERGHTPGPEGTDGAEPG